MSVNNREALLKLDFLIVGAGVAGLSTGYALARSGHRVRIFERYSSFDDIPVVGGIRLPPNAVKILAEGGCGEQLDKISRPIQGSTMFSMSTGAVVGHINWLEVTKEIDGRFLLTSHAALHRMIYEGCMRLGVKVEFGAAVESVAPGTTEDESPSLILKSGEVHKADIIIGADGWSSMVRRVVNDDKVIPRLSGLSCYTGMIPFDAIKEDEELQKLMEPSSNGLDWMVFMGSHRHIQSYPAGADGHTVHVFVPDSEISEDIDEALTWDHKVPTSLIMGSIDGACLLVQKLVKMLPPTVVRTPYTLGEVEEWVDETSRILLIGEAAHILRPCGTYTTSTAIEDAAMLGWLFAQLHSWDQVPALTEAYQDMRQNRVVHIAEAETMNVELCSLPPGPERDERDKSMRAAWPRDASQNIDGVLIEQFEALAAIYAYNPEETAEDWWVNWGVLRERAHNRVSHTQMRWDILNTVVNES